MHTDTPNESLYRALVEASPDAFLLSDFSGKIRIANPRAAEMGGFESAEELIGLNLFEFISGQDKDLVALAFEKLVRSANQGTIEATLIRKDGSTYDAELTGSLMRDGGNNPVGLISITRDITARKAMEKGLEIAKDNAEKANHLKDAFIANISHEIRTPLNAILGFTELIREETENVLSEEIDSYFSIIEISCDRLIQTVDMILNLSRLQIGMYTPEKKPVNPELIIKEVISKYHGTAEQKSLSLRFENKCGDIQLVTDVNCVRQPISIILDNAIKYTNKGSVRVTMQRDPDNWLQIEVADTGIGMHPDYLRRVFEPFSQEETGYTRRYSGLGLNLAIAKKLLDIIKAEILVVSRHGEGSVFTIKFPVN